MAAIIMPELGQPQTCDGPCWHIGCAYWRRIVGKVCVLCGEPVTSGQRFLFHRGPKRLRVVKWPEAVRFPWTPEMQVLRAPRGGGDHDVVHALCYEENLP